MKKKIVIPIIAVIITSLVVFIIYYNINHGKVSENKENKEVSIETGVEEVDFTSYSENDIKLNDKDISIKSAGVYNITGSIDSGMIYVETKGNVKLILDNVSIKNEDGPCIYISKASNVYIELKGENKLESTTNEELNGAIYSKNDLLLLGDGKLSITSNIDGIVTKDDLQINGGEIVIKASDDGIVGRDSVQIDNGKITIESDGDGIKSTNESKGAIKINGGSININSKLDGIQSITNLIINNGDVDIKTANGASVKSTNKKWMNNQTTNSSKGIKAENSIDIYNGNITINSEDDSIHSNGDIKINGGTISCTSGDDGIHADKDVYIKDGKIDIKESYEGIEGANITIDGGEINIKSSDDGFNAAGGDGSSQGRPGANREYKSGEVYTLTINDGNIYVNAAGDGLDSNGDIYINGGTIYVDGPTDNGNGAIDYGDGGSYKFEITGGTLIAVGSSGMAVYPTNGTKQTSVLINLDSSYKDKIKFGDITYEPSKSYNSILISSKELKTGKEYKLKIGDKEVETVTLSSTVTTIGNTSRGGNIGHGGMKGEKGRPGDMQGEREKREDMPNGNRGFGKQGGNMMIR